jgi:hypothetical protein
MLEPSTSLRSEKAASVTREAEEVTAAIRRSDDRVAGRPKEAFAAESILPLRGFEQTCLGREERTRAEKKRRTAP